MSLSSVVPVASVFFATVVVVVHVEVFFVGIAVVVEEIADVVAVLIAFLVCRCIRFYMCKETSVPGHP